MSAALLHQAACHLCPALDVKWSDCAERHCHDSRDGDEDPGQRHERSSGGSQDCGKALPLQVIHVLNGFRWSMSAALLDQYACHMSPVLDGTWHDCAEQHCLDSIDDDQDPGQIREQSSGGSQNEGAEMPERPGRDFEVGPSNIVCAQEAGKARKGRPHHLEGLELIQK